MRLVSNYLTLLDAGLRSALQYRANFVTMVLMGFVWNTTGFVFILVVLSRFHAIAGWTLGDVTFLYALRLLMHATMALLFSRLEFIDLMIREGEFDRFLLRPVSPLLQVMATRLHIAAIGDIIGGIAIFLIANRLIHVDWSPPAVAYLILAIIGGCLTEGAFKLVVAALSFRMLSINALTFLVGDIFNNFGNYPLTIYGGVLRLVLTFALPIAFVAYFPAAVLLRRTGEIGVAPILAYGAPLVGVVLFSLAYLFFQRETRVYQSSGH
jgi:ABC-2 type transport system permease protein